MQADGSAFCNTAFCYRCRMREALTFASMPRGKNSQREKRAQDLSQDFNLRKREVG